MTMPPGSEPGLVLAEIRQVIPSPYPVVPPKVLCTRHYFRERRRINVRSGVKEMHFSDSEDRALLVTHESLQIVDLIYNNVVKEVKKLAYPRYAKLSSCGTFFVASFTDSTVSLFDTRLGNEITKVIGVPLSTYIFVISGNGKKLLYGNNQQICLWNIITAEIEVLTQQWSNVNCYALRPDGGQFALGTYYGSLLVLTLVGDRRCGQMELKRHKSCIMLVVYNGNDVITVSYDRVLIIMTIQEGKVGEKVVSFEEHVIEQMPRSLKGCAGRIYLIMLKGIYWFNGSYLKGFNDGMYGVMTNEEGETIFVRYNNAELQWFA